MILPGKILLWLSSAFYGLAVALRNKLYDLGILKSRTFSLPVICVGNITVGGTGKTPHVIYLAEKLSDTMEVSVLSRGYLRKSSGFRIVRAGDSVDTAGDEPLLMARRMSKANVFVDRDRVHGITEILRTSPETKTIILDDGFQHRAVKAGLNILLTSHDRLMTRDHVMPLGRLRESPGGMKRADVIIVTKVPPGNTGEMDRIRKEMNITEQQSIYFTGFTYGKPIPLFGGAVREIKKTTTVLLVTGIADPAPLVKYLSDISGGVNHILFPDHHRFKNKDLDDITSAFDALSKDDKIIITTEKDGVRLKEITNIADRVREALYYLPVGVEFIENEDEFLKILYGYAGKDN
jgi:tetraacyldisaccharide 4'-kinase